MTDPGDQVSLLEGGQHPAQSSFGQPAIVGEIAGLPFAPDPEDEQNREPSPGEPFGTEYLSLHPVTDRVRGPVYIGYGEHRFEIQSSITKTSPNIPLGGKQFFRIVIGQWDRHLFPW